MTTGLVAGIDSSTQSTKVEVRALDTGDVVGTARSAHPPTTPPRSEQDPTSWWQALTAAFADLDPSIRSRIRALSVAGQQHGLVMLDERGEALRPAKLWNDTESAPQAAGLIEADGKTAWVESCGSVPSASFTVTKLAWVADNEPGLLERVAKLMLPHDYLTWRLTGRHVTDRGDASGTGWWSPVDGRYRAEALDRFGHPLSHTAPEVLGPAEVAGTVQPDVATQLGIGSSVKVGPGSGDNMGGALGLGLRPGDLAISIGTSGTAYAVSATPTADPTGLVAGFADATGNFLPLVCTLNATKVTEAFRSLLAVDHDEFDRLALSASVGSGGLVLVPYLDGERTPNRPEATGTLTGIRSDIDGSQLARAAVEGVVCGLLDGVDALTEAGVVLDRRTFLIGGGARSQAFRRVVADLSGRVVVVPDDDETVATGAAVQAAVIETGDDFVDIARNWGLGAGTQIEPDDAVLDGADEARSRYRLARDVGC